ncbi:hypothetical protein DSCW_49970 [Desulfosarcina widdelii]|uniref:Uncharacterized protein n=1 Tax=Desulfosarcina widdelii TaxID=947919 RepID=A0A5K7Z9X4_9BACT|nr:hypothetical protein [Desulfosarcina widdelii]BBO77580.1 hypothetical protein DSCW_49970 [Desulfosarcina widdelii]
MDIVMIGSASVKNQDLRKPVVRVASRKNGVFERRRNREDRRKSVRDGVVVSLSYRNDRRVNPDRRRS